MIESNAPHSNGDGHAEERAEERADERVDVRGMIRQASRPVHVHDLVRRGTRTISVLSRQKIDEMVNLAVKNIVTKYRTLAADLDAAPADVERESREEFTELFDSYQQTNAAKHALEQSAAGVSAELDELRAELEKQKALADGKLAEDAEKSILSGLDALEREIEARAGAAFERRRALLTENGETPEGLAEFGRIEQRMREMITKIVGEQRKYQRDRDVLLLERRVLKLQAQLKAMENALKAISAQKLLSSTAVQNMLRGLGLLDDDKFAERRKGMLKVVLQQNIQLRKDLKEYEAKLAVKPAGGSGSSGHAA